MIMCGHKQTEINTGHCVMSSGHSNAPTDAGLVQNLQPLVNTHTQM